jgi:hypothetical protein
LEEELGTNKEKEMQIVRRLLVAVGAIALAATVLTLATPKSVHALIATLVQVSNTSANPVPTVATDNPGLQPLGNFQFTTAGPPNFTLPVPAGKTLVLEEFGVDCAFLTDPLVQTSIILYVQNSSIATVYTFVPEVLGGHIIVTQPVHIYADAGSYLQIGTGINLTGYPGLSCSASFSGHYVNVP